jgi:hypothetical protein
MVSLATIEAFPSTENKSLHDSAFWYPQAPPRGLNLNEDCFTARNNAINQYYPLCWNKFGGPGGIYLRSLTGISTVPYSYFGAMEFHYNNDDIPAECRTIGTFRGYRPAASQPALFAIDGPGGEVIDSITVYTRQCACFTYGFTWTLHGEEIVSFEVRSTSTHAA